MISSRGAIFLNLSEELHSQDFVNFNVISAYLRKSACQSKLISVQLPSFINFLALLIVSAELLRNNLLWYLLVKLHHVFDGKKSTKTEKDQSY